jgi:hypothetical protein
MTNYQKKYLKYKLKYFNLLNQLGGYNEEEFNEILNNPDENGYLILNNELLTDPISLSEIHKDNAIYIDKQIYDANSLSETIEKYYLNNKKLANNPLNRNEYTKEDYNLIADHISGIDDKIIKKRKEIINEIINLIQLDKDIIKIILDEVQYKHRKIFLNDHKFKIFIKFDYKTKMNLLYNKKVLNEFIEIFNNYEKNQIKNLIEFNNKINDQKVLDNEIINDQTFQYLKLIKEYFIKHNVERFKLVINFLYQTYIVKNNEFLFFFPEEYMTDEIIKLHSTALEYVPKNKITFEICEIAVKENGLALQYVPIDKFTNVEYSRICELALKQEGIALQYASIDNLEYNYQYICTIAIVQNGHGLKYVIPDKMTNKEYLHICKYSVEENGMALKHVIADKMTNKEYLSICKLALKQNGSALDFVIFNKIPEDEYFNICRQAVKQEGLALNYVIVDKITVQEYFNICMLAVEQEGLALNYVIVDKMSEDEYFNICVLAVKQEGLALDYVQVDKMSEDEYFNICVLAVKQEGFALDSVIVDKITVQEYFNICMLAVEQNSSALDSVIVDKMSEDEYFNICVLAIKQNSSVLKYVKVDKLSKDKYKYISEIAI